MVLSCVLPSRYWTSLLGIRDFLRPQMAKVVRDDRILRRGAKSLGCGLSKTSQWISSCILWLHEPCDPSNLAVTRILFGTLMVLDQPEERGLAFVEERWGDPKQCHFPLFDFLKPLSVEGMYAVHTLILLGALGIATGTFFRSSCWLFLVPYWYIFLLEKSWWNNHSYLYSLLTLLLSTTGAHKLWSVDAWRKPGIYNTHVPRWNYFVLRSQVFLVYFIAGLKKMNGDWTGGFSMTGLAQHWVFEPFRFILTDDQIDFYLIHWGGFLFDLTAGFLMVTAATRPVGLLFCLAFNGMNSRMFEIGMFAYVMIALAPLFLNYEWPKAVLTACPAWIKRALPDVADPTSCPDDCWYESKKEKCSNQDTRTSSSLNRKMKLTALGLCLYLGLQAFLPYSHWLTKGYNTWSQGTYGYSWDMMVHSWRSIHVKVTVRDNVTGQVHFIDPSKFTTSHRWHHKADMVVQFAHCIQERLEEDLGMKIVQFNIDTWMSLNGRFAQRMYDPTVNILEYSWSPFKEVPWVLPVLTKLNDWRAEFQRIQEESLKDSALTDIEFMADFPGFSLVNYIDEGFENASLQVLSGAVAFYTASKKCSTVLQRGDKINIPLGEYHKVTPLKHSVACYLYVFTDRAQSPETNTSVSGNSTWAGTEAGRRGSSYYFNRHLESWQISFHRLGRLLQKALNKSDWFRSRFCSSCKGE